MSQWIGTAASVVFLDVIIGRLAQIERLPRVASQGSWHLPLIALLLQGLVPFSSTGESPRRPIVAFDHPEATAHTLAWLPLPAETKMVVMPEPLDEEAASASRHVTVHV